MMPNANNIRDNPIQSRFIKPTLSLVEIDDRQPYPKIGESNKLEKVTRYIRLFSCVVVVVVLTFGCSINNGSVPSNDNSASRSGGDRTVLFTQLGILREQIVSHSD